VKPHHTPGPWTHDGGGSVSVVLDGHPRQVAMACGQAASRDERASTSEVMHANGTLIAAAPEMFAALCAALEYAPHGETCDPADGTCNCWLRFAHAALVKAGARMPDGTTGVRDVDAPCEAFRPGTPAGHCDTDGHYLCAECRVCRPHADDWPCEKSPTMWCEYDEGHETCRHCGQPYEREG
jgi:hypothetical protein